ncbi:MAG: ER membrane glycoprotein subunit of the GPI transamidase complex-like protein [Geoglossum simile]|nr:MAG: ER membrane glycoprotein subunit of the GPI transamidase complex-like protein [Geoglossum simile]
MQRQRRRWEAFSESSPTRALLCIFVIWKALLLLVVTLSPGPDYDTSTLLLLHGGDDRGPSSPSSRTNGGHRVWLSRGAPHGLEKLVRWDAIYFAKISERGYLYEQEWAFGWGFTRLIALSTKVGGKGNTSLSAEINTGIAIAHIAHLFSVIVLYRLTELMFGGRRGRKLAFIASVLHIITPAGVFLSAPYAESLFSLLNFSGHLIYATGSTPSRGGRSWGNDLLLVLSGAAFGLATTMRSNGLLNGIIYLFDVASELRSLSRNGIGIANARKIVALGVAGVLVGLGTVIPQWIAYLEYCSGTESDRPWCRHTIPSVYTWVQDHYWNVGFMRYWTFSNLPLFALAGPMLSILGLSAIWALRRPNIRPAARTKRVASPAPGAAGGESFTRTQLQKFAMPQLVLTILALTTYHVQIITRISSGYVVWYWWLAFLISEEPQIVVFGRKWNLAKPIVRWMVVYAILQSGLFASFLPPA